MCFLAAVSEGLPTVAASLFAALTVGDGCSHQAGRLGSTGRGGRRRAVDLRRLAGPAGERQVGNDDGGSVVHMWAPRSEMVRRMRFTELPLLAAG